MFRLGFAMLLGGLLSACGGAERPAPRRLATADAVAGAKIEEPAKSLESEPAGRPALFALSEKPPLDAPRIALRVPQPDAVLEAASAAEMIADVDAREWLGAGEGHRVALVLDNHRARYLGRGAKAYRIGDLVTAGTNLTQGEHRLTAIAVASDGTLVKPIPGEPAPFSSVRFWVGERMPAPSVPPQALVYVEPQGTYNGEAEAAGARLDYYLTGTDEKGAIQPVDVTIWWSGGHMERRLTRWTAWGLSNLTSGDYEVELRFANSDGKAANAQPVRSSFTVNLDAKVKPVHTPAASPGAPGSTPGSGR